MNTPGPILSVVLSSCNQLAALKFTLLSLRDQQPDLPHEIIVVDCGSIDGSAQFLATQAQNGAIQSIFDSETQSRVAARNKGAHQAKGEYLMFLDPGMVVGPRWWESLVRTLEKDPKVAATAGKIVLPDGRIDHAGLALLEWWEKSDGDAGSTAYGQQITGRSIQAGRPAESAGSNQPLRVQALSGEAIMVRSSAFFSIGGFSARVGRNHQSFKPDFSGELAGLDICLRLGSRGWDCIYRPESVMTRLRLKQPDGKKGPGHFPEDREQEVFNKTWIGRVRGDFKIMPEGGTVPTENGLIHHYIEPVIGYGLSRNGSTVIMACHDSLKEVQRGVTALLTHTEPHHEFIFVDCGSTDGSRQYLETMVEKRDNCRLLTNEFNPGFATAHNQGLAAARGQHLVLLGQTAVVTPRWLEALIATAEMHPRAGLVGPMTNSMIGMQHQGPVDYDENNLRGLNSFAAQVAEAQTGKSDKAMRLSGFCLLIKKELMARVGGLDEKFHLGNYEGNDYCLRAQLAGYHALVARDSFVHLDSQGMLSEEQIKQLDRIKGQWEIFKSKWGLPRETALGEPMDLAALMAGGYQVGRHFQPLPQPIIEPGAARRKKKAHA